MPNMPTWSVSAKPDAIVRLSKTDLPWPEAPAWADDSYPAASRRWARERSIEYRVPSNQVAGRVRTDYARQDRNVGQVGTKEVEIGTETGKNRDKSRD